MSEMVKEFGLGEQGLQILVEETAFEGVKRIAGRVAGDIGKVTGRRPEIVEKPENAEKTQGSRAAGKIRIFCGTVGKSPLLDRLAAKGRFDTAGLAGKREVYKLEILQEVFPGTPQTLVICGSDKRGTIYGMFALSEYIGVSPLCFWGDAQPLKNSGMKVKEDIETLSKEPSVKYRGFFINDEWPCFGNWVNTHFGGFGASAYEHVFELLLRLKGNYLWPAMWSASFPLDGPGGANEELADIYGVVMGYSHHEPCLRASEEWDKVRGEGSRYGSEWNFYTNEEGLLNYWADGLKRSGKYENIITIGMRGERDTSMLGENSAVAENIALLKDIITKQRELIRTYVNEDLNRVPQLLALYKEVEAYFYGDEHTRGLKDWEGLDGVTCMLCEDNFGHMRTLPTEEMRDRKGGFGMYYHLDYHGGPVSYEWVDSTPFSKIWEQMCTAYEYGIREVWIVNAGDLKFHEVPLSYFLSMAYDYDRWGAGNPDSYREYVKEWTEKTFPEAGAWQKEIGEVLTQYIDINHMRRPESLHEGVYHPCHYGETDRMLKKADRVQRLSAQIYEALNDREKTAYYSMIHFPADASMNLLKMHLYAGKNAHFASQGKPVANIYTEKTAQCISTDRELARQFADFCKGKWKGMELAPHIGFTRWNEDGYRYPVTMHVEPVHKPRMVVSRKDEEGAAVKNYGSPAIIAVPDFRYPGCESVTLEIANGGIGSFTYEIRAEKGELPFWLKVAPMQGEIALQEEVTLTCLEDLLPEEEQTVRLLITGEDTCVAVEVTGKARAFSGLPEMTFLQREETVVMGAGHFCRKKDTAKGRYEVMEGYGSYGTAVRVFPFGAAFTAEEEKPSLTYRFRLQEAGNYRVEILTAPTNPALPGQSLHVLLENSLGDRKKTELVPGDFKAGDTGYGPWCRGVLDQVRRSSAVMRFESGIQELTVGAMEAGVVLERLLIYPEGSSLKPSYLGPEETYYCKRSI